MTKTETYRAVDPVTYPVDPKKWKAAEAARLEDDEYKTVAPGEEVDSWILDKCPWFLSMGHVEVAAAEEGGD